MDGADERTHDSQTAEEIRRLRRLIVGLVVAAGSWFWYHQRQQDAADCGRRTVDAIMRDQPAPKC